MDKQTYSVEKNSKILVKTYGNLVVRGSENADLGVKAGRHELKMVREENNMAVTAMGNCEIWLPGDVEVVIDKVGGKASLHDFPGNALINRVGGDFTIENAGQIVVGKVGGRLAARKLTSLTLDKVGGSCVVEEVSGAFKVDKVGGDCSLKAVVEAAMNKVGGDIDLQCITLSGSTVAGGDIRLSVNSIENQTASVRAGGDVKFYLPEGTQMNLEITSHSEDIRLQISDQVMRLNQEKYSYHMGEELPTLVIDARGDVTVSDEPWTPSDFDETFDRDEIGIDWDFSGGIDDTIARNVERAVARSTRIADISTRIGEKAARKGEAAVRRAEKRIERMMRSMDIEDRSSGSDWSAEPPQPPQAPEAPSAISGISEEERIAVLRMLQEKKISLEEAERLLDALESFSE
jgi:hypothetical protein